MWTRKFVALFAILCCILSVCWCKHSKEDHSREHSGERRDGKHKKPHVIFMLADDFGWNDIGFHNKDMLTPTLNDLAAHGVILNQSYVQNMCTPSRAALMTGYFPFRNGMQSFVIPGYSPMGLPLQFELLPQKLKKLGYATHSVGKWHLGSCSPAYYPNNRGFDSFFGYMNGGEYYFDHSTPFLSSSEAEATNGVPNVYDFFNQSEVSWKYRGTHSSIPFTKQVKHLLQNLNPDKPLFLYLPFQLTHTPLEVPAEMLSLYKKEKNPARKTFSAMVSTLDRDVAEIVKLLKKHGFYKNSVIIFSGDNGGEVLAGGNNYPLRGSKHTLYEGGHRAAAFVHSPLLKKTGYTYNGLIHLVDWYQTIVSLAGEKPNKTMDGYDVWPAISENSKSPRSEFVYHLENNGRALNGAIRVGDWKLIVGTAGLPNTAVLPKDVQGRLANVPGGNSHYDDIPNAPHFRLFNIKTDPTEERNLALVRPLVVAQLLLHFDRYKNQMVYSVFRGNDMAMYQRLNQNLTSLGRNWCNPIPKVKVINWREELQTDVYPL